MGRIKGWKKSNVTKDFMYWNESQGGFLRIKRVFFVVRSKGNSKGEGWSIVFKGREIGVTKTKVRALKFAREYMRSHPRG